MSRGPARFQAADVARALKGAAAAGMPVARVEVDRDGKIVVVIGKAADHSIEANEWDVELNDKAPAQAR
jgi:hypothetical protein